MKRIIGFFALLAVVALPAIGCGPGEAVIPEDAEAYNEAEGMSEGSSTASVSLEDELKEKEGN